MCLRKTVEEDSGNFLPGSRHIRSLCMSTLHYARLPNGLITRVTMDGRRVLYQKMLSMQHVEGLGQTTPTSEAP
jgi:hypothetical protein